MDVPKRIRVVSASREAEADFRTGTALGRSLSLYRSELPMVELRLFGKNTRGLSAVYNEAIAECTGDPAILLFVHDDLHICDFYWVEQIYLALQMFDIIGVAGNKRRVPNQPGWAFVDTNFTWDAMENLSGVVGHGKGFPPTTLSVYGPPLQEVKLLDGLLLACSSNTLRKSGLKFDEQFAFDFYDMDFCRQAEIKNLRMGTCKLSVVHESVGRFRREDWRAAYGTYLRKWGS